MATDISVFTQFTEKFIANFDEMRAHAMPGLIGITLAYATLSLALTAARSGMEGFNFIRILLTVLAACLTVAAIREFDFILNSILHGTSELANLTNIRKGVNYYEDPSALWQEVVKVSEPLMSDLTGWGLIRLSMVGLCSIIVSIIVLASGLLTAAAVFYLRARIAVQATLLFVMLPFFQVPVISGHVTSLLNGLLKLVIQSMSVIIGLNTIPVLITFYKPDSLKLSTAAMSDIVAYASLAVLLPLVVFLGFSVGGSIGGNAIGTLDDTYNRYRMARGYRRAETKESKA